MIYPPLIQNTVHSRAIVDIRIQVRSPLGKHIHVFLPKELHDVVHKDRSIMKGALELVKKWAAAAGYKENQVISMDVQILHTIHWGKQAILTYWDDPSKLDQQ